MNGKRTKKDEQEDEWIILLTKGDIEVYREIDQEEAMELVPVLLDQAGEHINIPAEASNEELIKDPRIRRILMQYYNNCINDIAEEDPELFSKTFNDFSEFESNICRICPIQYKTYAIDCFMGCPIEGSKEAINDGEGMRNYTFDLDQIDSMVPEPIYTDELNFKIKGNDISEILEDIGDEMVENIKNIFPKLNQKEGNCPHCHSDDVKIKDAQEIEPYAYRIIFNCENCGYEFSKDKDRILQPEKIWDLIRKDLQSQEERIISILESDQHCKKCNSDGVRFFGISYDVDGVGSTTRYLAYDCMECNASSKIDVEHIQESYRIYYGNIRECSRCGSASFEMLNQDPRRLKCIDCDLSFIKGEDL